MQWSEIVDRLHRHRIFNLVEKVRIFFVFSLLWVPTMPCSLCERYSITYLTWAILKN